MAHINGLRQGFQDIALLFLVDCQKVLAHGDGIVKQEASGVLEFDRESVDFKVPRKRARNIGKEKANVILSVEPTLVDNLRQKRSTYGKTARKDGGKSGNGVVSRDPQARICTVGEDDDGGNFWDVLPNCGSDAVLVFPVFLKATCVREARSIEHGDLYTVCTLESVDLRRVGLTLRSRSSGLVFDVIRRQIVFSGRASC